MAVNCGHWVLCFWDHGCVLPCGIPLPPVVHQHKGDGCGQARSEQETVHAVHAEVSWMCRNCVVCVHCVKDQINFSTFWETAGKHPRCMVWEFMATFAFIF